VRVLGIAGSLRRDSYNRRLLLEAAEALPAGAELEVFEGLRALPPYDEDDDGDHGDEAVVRLRRAIEEADAVLFATPEYNGSVPGQLKNAVDWASRPRGAAALLGKPVAVIGASTGAFGAVWAQAELRKVLARAGARVVEGGLSVPHAQVQLAETGRLADDAARETLRGLLARLLAEAKPPVTPRTGPEARARRAPAVRSRPPPRPERSPARASG
jgi:chromate reductase